MAGGAERAGGMHRETGDQNATGDLLELGAGEGCGQSEIGGANFGGGVCARSEEGAVGSGGKIDCGFFCQRRGELIGGGCGPHSKRAAGC